MHVPGEALEATGILPGDLLLAWIDRDAVVDARVAYRPLDPALFAALPSSPAAYNTFHEFRVLRPSPARVENLHVWRSRPDELRPSRDWRPPGWPAPTLGAVLSDRRAGGDVVAVDVLRVWTFGPAIRTEDRRATASTPVAVVIPSMINRARSVTDRA